MVSDSVFIPIRPFASVVLRHVYDYIYGLLCANSYSCARPQPAKMIFICKLSLFFFFFFFFFSLSPTLPLICTLAVYASLSIQPPRCLAHSAWHPCGSHVRSPAPKRFLNDHPHPPCSSSMLKINSFLKGGGVGEGCLLNVMSATCYNNTPFVAAHTCVTLQLQGRHLHCIRTSSPIPLFLLLSRRLSKMSPPPVSFLSVGFLS